MLGEITHRHGVWGAKLADGSFHAFTESMQGIVSALVADGLEGYVSVDINEDDDAIINCPTTKGFERYCIGLDVYKTECPKCGRPPYTE